MDRWTRPDRGAPSRLQARPFPLVVGALLVLILALTLWRSGGPGTAAAGTAPSPPSRASRSSSGGSGSASTSTPSPTPTIPVSAEQAALQRFIALGQPIYCGGPNKPYVALTFDDGPGPYTPYTLKLLKRAHMSATFFLVGRLLAEPAFAGYPRAEAAFNAVGEHTWDHVAVTGLSQSGLDAQIGRTQTAVAKAAGQPVQMFRPPFGATNARVADYVRSHGMIQVLWTIDSGDSAPGTTAQKELATIKKNLSPGAIILMHENRGNTRNSLPRILELVKRSGLTPVTVPQLLTLDPPSRQQLRSHSCG